MKRRIVGLLIFVLLLAAVVGCEAAVEPEATVEPTETVVVSPTDMETTEVEETPTIEETSDFSEKSDVTGTPDATREGEPTMTPSGQDTREDLPQVELAKADLAQRLNVAPETIEVVEVEERTWPDAGMGCPQPGMAYIQVPQDGLLIRLRASGQVYDYHSGGTRDPFLCEQAETLKKTTPEFGEEIVPPPSLDE